MKQTLVQSTRETDIAIGAKIRRFRKGAGISQEVVAEALGITFQQVQKYENGKNRVAVSTLIRICHVIGISPMDIIGSYFDGAPTEPSAHSRIAQRLSDAEQQLAQVRAIVFGRKAVLIGMDLATQPDTAALQ